MGGSVMIVLAQQAAYSAVSIMLLLQIGLGVVITLLAAVGYRNNKSRPMLFLAVGIAFLTVIQSAVSIVLAQTGPTHLISIGTQLSEIIGLMFILVSIILARKQ